MQTILVTGSTGAGKSTLLTKLAKQHCMTIIDPYLPGASKTWQEPAVATCGGVVIDHVRHLDNAKAVVSSAAKWCDKHSVDLWLGEIWHGCLEQVGIVISGEVIELHLDREAKERPTPPQPGMRSVGTLQQMQPLAERIAGRA